jgi:hypothetical protein
MVWVRLEDEFPDHPKVDAAGPLASWLFVTSLCYANKHLTNGFISESRVKRLADDFKAREARKTPAAFKNQPWNDESIYGPIVTVEGMKT